MKNEWVTHELEVGQACSVDELLHREWLLTNGTGAYAMGTAAGVNTRRYHGLLVAASQPPVGRILTLNQVFEQITIQPKRSRVRKAGVPTGAVVEQAVVAADAGKAALAVAPPAMGGGLDEDPIVLQFGAAMFRADSGETFQPSGHNRLTRIEKGLTVCWTYRHEKIEVTRELALHYKEQAATLTYRVTGTRGLDASRVVFSLRPIFTLRDFHGLLRQGTASDLTARFTASRSKASTLRVERGSVVATVGCPGARFTDDPQWWYNFHYPIETDRGQGDTEDGWIPGTLEYTIDPKEDESTISLTVALGERAVDAGEVGEDGGRRGARAAHLAPIVDYLANTAGLDDRGNPVVAKKTKKGTGPAVALDMKTVRTLAIAADDFVVDRTLGGKTLSTILAGYPWFADWGRDTFIALPGLLLATGRHEEARSVLRVFSGAIKHGLIPNRFDDYNDAAAHYNTVDASLWFVNAAMQYREVTGDTDTWDAWLEQAAMCVIDAYLKGTDYDIRMAGDGLITAGSAHTQLTWMDAACGGTVFTPRHGKPVEINALWYNALAGMSGLIADSHPQVAKHYGALAKRVTRAFLRVFWNADLGYLNDHVWTDEQGEDHTDTTCRPNQIFVCSLPHSPLPQTKQRMIVAAVKERLLTPFGLRTLPRDDPRYHPHYQGTMYERDGAYHQGTVWPWLIGPYAEAVLRLGKFKPAAKAEALGSITPLMHNMLTTGLGQVNEIHDGDPPHQPVGCIAQAWSVAELVRILTLIHRPPSKG